MKTSGKKSARKSSVVKNDRSSKRDRSKYKFAGNLYGKAQLVLAVVQKYLKDHPKATLDSIQEVMKAGSYPLVTTVQKAKKISGDHQRYFFGEDKILKTADGKKVVVCNQWGINNINSFIELTKKLGYRVAHS